MISLPSANEVHNIKEAVQLLRELLAVCPGLKSHPTFIEELKKLKRLTATDEAIRENFRTGDEGDLGGDQARTRRRFNFLWVVSILIARDITGPRRLDRNNCRDVREVLRLALVLWHEAHHWNDWDDGPVQDLELALLETLEECLRTSAHPCREQMIGYLRQEAIPENRKQKDEAGSGWWNWFKKWVLARGGVTLILVLILLWLTIGTAGTIWSFLLKGILITAVILLYLWFRRIMCRWLVWWQEKLLAIWVWGWVAILEVTTRIEEVRKRIVRWIEKKQWELRQRRVDACTRWPYGTRWLCKLGTYIVEYFWELVTVVVEVVEWVVKTVTVVVIGIVWTIETLIIIVLVLVPNLVFWCWPRWESDDPCRAAPAG